MAKNSRGNGNKQVRKAERKKKNAEKVKGTTPTNREEGKKQAKRGRKGEDSRYRAKEKKQETSDQCLTKQPE